MQKDKRHAKKSQNENNYEIFNYFTTLSIIIR